MRRRKTMDDLKMLATYDEEEVSDLVDLVMSCQDEESMAALEESMLHD